MVVEPIEEFTARIGLAWRILGKNQCKKLEGKKACNDFLRKVVDVLIAEISDSLKSYDRRSTLRRLVGNCEKAYADEDHWIKTSSAILGLHGNESETNKRFVDELSRFAGAAISSRILIEMAVCDSLVDGGTHVSDIELGKLVARASLVVKFGGLSDAIRYNVLAPELEISPLGDVMFRDEFGHMVVEPMLSRAVSERVIAVAPLQKKNYEEPQIASEVKGKISEEFWEIWKIEMGFDIDEARKIISILEDKGIKDHASVFTIKKSEYLALVCSYNLSKAVAEKFLDQFSLFTRPSWNIPPKGFPLKEIYPWRFGRRLSYIVRPILSIDNCDDPRLIVAPGAIRKAFAYVFDGAYKGSLDQSFFRSIEMRNTWLGKAHEGHSFNAEVAEAISDAGWKVRENIGLPEIFNCKLEKDYGDVDVLAWRLDRSEVLIIECKNLSLARNYSEIAALLSEYQGLESKGKPDKLKRHLNRVEFIKDNHSLLQRFTGVEGALPISCLICSGVVPMKYANIEALKNTVVGGISDVLKL